MELNKLKEACKVLGLNHKDFISLSEVEKGVIDDYKVAYEQQRKINEQILNNISEISKSFDNQLQDFSKKVLENIENQIKEINKSVNSLSEEVDGMRKTPMRQAKSATKVSVIEKAVNQNNNGVKTYDLNDFRQKQEIKRWLGDKALEELQKGINGGTYERAAMQLDANGKLSTDLIKKILEQDKILIK